MYPLLWLTLSSMSSWCFIPYSQYVIWRKLLPCNIWENCCPPLQPAQLLCTKLPLALTQNCDSYIFFNLAIQFQSSTMYSLILNLTYNIELTYKWFQTEFTIKRLNSFNPTLSTMTSCFHQAYRVSYQVGCQIFSDNQVG